MELFKNLTLEEIKEVEEIYLKKYKEELKILTSLNSSNELRSI